MLTIERLIREIAAMPVLTRLGLLVFVLGGASDVLAHLLEAAAGPTGHAATAHTAAELDAHLVVFVGMVLIFLGVVVDGAIKARTRRPAGHSKGVA